MACDNKSLLPGRATATRFLYSIASCAVCVGAASAQTGEQAEETAAAPIVVDEIVVTARRIEEDLRDTPAAVSVQTAEDFAPGKVDTLQDIGNRTPNVLAFDANGQTFIIRGVGSPSVQGLNSEVGVGLFIDEVYLGRPDSAPQFPFDLDRSEIIRGTQSTLYGRNTIGGAVNLIPRRPGPEQSGEGEVTVGYDGFVRGKIAWDQPLTEDARWLTRAALAITEDPDGIENLPTGDDDGSIQAVNGRFTLTGEIGDSTFLTFTLDAETIDDDTQGGWAVLPLAFDQKSDLDFPASREDDRGGVMLRLEHDFENFAVASTTAFRGFDQDLILDGDFTSDPNGPLPQLLQGRDQLHRQFTQELRIGSLDQTNLAAGDFSWNAGFFFLTERFDGLEFFGLAALPREQADTSTLESDTTAYSVYGSAAYQVLEPLTLRAGLRYTYEESDGDAAATSPAGTGFFGPPNSGSASISSSNISPEFGLDYRFGNGTLAWARAARGFKSGGIAQFFDANGDVNTYDEETAWTYEAGLKAPLFGGRAAVDVTLFRTVWDDQQANVFISDFQRVTANAASSKSQGIEVGLDAQLTEEVRLRASYGYLDADFDDFTFSFFSQTFQQDVTLDFSGNPLPLAPEHSATITLDWEKPLPNGAVFTASTSYTYLDEFTFDPEANFFQPETHLLDAALSYGTESWTATVWAKNLLNEDYLSNYFLFGTTDFGIAAPPRTFGLTVTAKF